MFFTIADVAEPLNLVAYFTKGLGDVVLDEVRELLLDAQAAAEPGDRFIVVRTGASNAATLIEQSRTIDDLRVMVAGPVDVATSDDLDALCRAAAVQTERLLGEERRGTPNWSVTVAARNPVWRHQPKWSPGPSLARNLRGADIQGTERQPVDLRLQIDGVEAHFALNLTPQPIGKTRRWEGATRLGALRPTVAAALVRLAVAHAPPASSLGLYDPFCGTGTIVEEAARLGLPVFASDIDVGAVELTRTRLARLTSPSGGELAHRVFVHDVLQGVPTRVNAALIVSNLPWGKQVPLQTRLAVFENTAVIVARGLSKGGACALLTTHDDQLVAIMRRVYEGATLSTQRIGLLGQTPGIVLAAPEA